MPSIWVVDDEPLIRHAIVSVLEEIGHQVENFGDAEQLYRRLVECEDELPDLLILDHMLPDEDGAQIVHSLRERPQYRDLPLLFVTAVDDESAERLADLDAGRPQAVRLPRPGHRGGCGAARTRK